MQDSLRSDLTGQNAIVTGGSRGIGFAVASALCSQGARVLITSRSPEKLEEARRAITTAVPAAVIRTMPGNAGDPAHATACTDAAMAEFGSVDILVNNAGTNAHYGALVDIEAPQAMKNFQTNVLAPLLWTQCAWSASMQHTGGCVINISSVGAMTTDRAIAFYNTTKAALDHLTRELAAELAPRVRVNAIAPGVIKTDLSRAIWEKDEDALAAGIPLGRLGTPSDVAEMALFLAGPGAAYVTGQTMVVDGGLLARPQTLL